MSIFLKKHLSKAAKIAGIALFALLMFVNVKVMTNESNSGDIDLFGLKISVFTPSAYASGGGWGGGTKENLKKVRSCVIVVNGISQVGVEWYCSSGGSFCEAKTCTEG